jgi:hypothetical protein
MDLWGLAVVGLLALGTLLPLFSWPVRGRWAVTRVGVTAGGACCLASATLILAFGPRPRPAAPPGMVSVDERVSRMRALSGPEPPAELAAMMRKKMAEMAAKFPGKAKIRRMALAAKGPTRLGAPAPAFTLPDIRTGEPVRLGDVLSDRPLVLVFGSWGCTVFCEQFRRVAELEKEYRGKADFLLVEVMEAPHPLPAELAQAFAAAGLSEETAENRMRRAVLAADVMRSPFRQLLDTPEGEVCACYKSFPERLYVVYRGVVVHDAGLGLSAGAERGWKLSEVRSYLDTLLKVR